MFLACQVGLALLLLSGAILMIRSFIHLLDVDPGFRPAAFWLPVFLRRERCT